MPESTRWYYKIPAERFLHQESRGIISNLIMITELFYLHILNMNGDSLHTRNFRRVHVSVFRYTDELKMALQADPSQRAELS